MPRKKKSGGGALGKSLIRDRFKGRQTTANGKERALNHTSELNDGYDWGRMGGVSVTEQGALEDFLTTAALAGTEFTAEKLNVHVVTQIENEALPSAEKRKARAKAEKENLERLRIPRRPAWTRETTAEELQYLERESFLEWRRELADLEETTDVLLTPFERNLDFWRQLWRVIERSDVVVQIVDARNPLLFRCVDVELYVNEVDPQKLNLLLINKADLLTVGQREQWASYFKKNNISFVFFSAVLETEKHLIETEKELARLALEDMTGVTDAVSHMQDQDSDTEDGEGDEDEEDEEESEGDEEGEDVASPADVVAAAEADTEAAVAALQQQASDEDEDGDEESDGEATIHAPSGYGPGSEEGQDEKATPDVSHLTWRQQLEQHSMQLYDVDMLVDLFAKMGAGAVTEEHSKPTIGLVGYPNVGKSSSINAICKTKKVSVSATPGKTKHFQTIILPEIQLCDCPGLVFPNFASTKAELVCNGILPVDQMRDVIPPMTYVAETIPRQVLEQTYGIHVIKPAEDEDPNRPPTAYEVLNAYGFARGFMNARGMPDAHRAGRAMLKDFVKGKLLYCKPPPGYEQLTSLIPTSEDGITDGSSVAAPRVKARDMDSSAVAGPMHNPRYANAVDDQFFREQHVGMHQKGPGTAASKANPKSSKKHHKGKKKEKLRRRFGHA
eukprot:m.355830 g.355830  ORF g.355830 m.355830 type:complete len:674 (+) comp17352_c0_seq1:64-2085(+)